jgi:hypothetical protein
MAPPISRPDGIPDSLIVSWIDNTQLIKDASSDLNSHSLLDCDGRISDRPSHQKVKTQVQRLKTENHEKRCVMTFLFLQEKRSKPTYEELNGVLREAAASLATIKRECRRFKDGNFHLVTNLSLTDRAGTLERSYLSFSANSHSFLHVFSRRGLQ